jgi:hypothetical protein
MLVQIEIGFEGRAPLVMDDDDRRSAASIENAVAQAFQLLEQGKLATAVDVLAAVSMDSASPNHEELHAACYAKLVLSEVLINAQNVEEAIAILDVVLQEALDREERCQGFGIGCFALEICTSTMMKAEIWQVQCQAGFALETLSGLVVQLKTGEFQGRKIPHSILDTAHLETVINQVRFLWHILGNSGSVLLDNELKRFEELTTDDCLYRESWTFPIPISGERVAELRAGYWELAEEANATPEDSFDRSPGHSLEIHDHTRMWCALVPYSQEAKILRSSSSYEQLQSLITHRRYELVKDRMAEFLIEISEVVSVDHFDSFDLMVAQWCNDISYELLIADIENEDIRHELFWIAKYNLDFSIGLQRQLWKREISTEIALSSARSFELLASAASMIDDIKQLESNRRKCELICRKVVGVDPMNVDAQIMLSSFSRDSFHDVPSDSFRSADSDEFEIASWGWNLTDSRRILMMFDTALESN